MNDFLLLCCCFEWDGKGKNVQSHLGLAYSTFYHLSLFLKRLLISEYGHNLEFFGSWQSENGIIGTFSRKIPWLVAFERVFALGHIGIPTAGGMAKHKKRMFSRMLGWY